MSARSATSASHSTDKRNIPKRCSARIALQPDFVQAHGNRGTTLRELNRPKEAEEAYRQALALRPNDPETLDNLALALRDLGRLDEAAQVLRHALTVQPDSAKIRLHLNAVLAAHGIEKAMPKT